MKAVGYFHFSLGPVQDFIYQARRTRDFWAGSFVLSWLSAVAMREVIEQTGSTESILFPKIESDFLDFLEGDRGTRGGPAQGSVPNRFKAEIYIESFEPEKVVEAVQAAWKSLADQVWKGDLNQWLEEKDRKEKVDRREQTKKIWDQQISSFLEAVWVIMPDKAQSGVLDQRKNWRNHRSPDEPGVKCMMMDGWQELSGEERPNVKKIDGFWNEMLSQGQTGIKSDIRPGEHLCAIAFVKRRFARYFSEIKKISMPGDWSLSGWYVSPARPSVTYMAAVHFIKNLIDSANQSEEVKNAFAAFYAAGSELEGEHSEWDTHIECISRKMSEGEDRSEIKRWVSLDGNLFFESALENENIYPESGKAQAVTTQLRNLRNVSGIALPSPFYAVLAMDGDLLGFQMKDLRKQEDIAEGLGTFTQGVSNIVKKANGSLIYAGGDDVLAILPIEDALPCAHKLRSHYMECFRLTSIDTSISAGISFVHIKVALNKVLSDVQKLLKNIAKDKTGRDALAVQVVKPGGVAAQWSMPWELALEGTGDKAELALIRLAELLNKDEETIGESGQLSNQFLYKIQERIELLNPLDGEDPLFVGDIDVMQVPRKTSVELLSSEYLSSGIREHLPKGVDPMGHAREIVGPLLQQCTERRSLGEGEFSETGTITMDAALLMRFLAHKGVE
ncbi:MAG: type III-B CRISPR-associated protein Cas10/Cmr2 [Gammaproteobacteria bacterium]|nr:type III-B CRISPR-associated protein Cas10/Cmr2 [Gammaproteobacteria bacterium]